MTQTLPPLPSGEPRLRLADRQQVKFRCCGWNDLLPDDHQARVVWKYVIQTDLSPLLEKIKSVWHNAGHPATDPRILVALWFYATLRGIGSARELDRRCGSSGTLIRSGTGQSARAGMISSDAFEPPETVERVHPAIVPRSPKKYPFWSHRPGDPHTHRMWESFTGPDF